MNSTETLGMNFKEQLTNACDKFSEWIYESQAMLNLLKNAETAIEELKKLDDAPLELQKVADNAVTIQSTKCKYVYVETEDNNFHFYDVRIENYDDYLTIYDEDGVLKFRCQIDEIVNFMREE